MATTRASRGGRPRQSWDASAAATTPARRPVAGRADGPVRASRRARIARSLVVIDLGPAAERDEGATTVDHVRQAAAGLGGSTHERWANSGGPEPTSDRAWQAQIRLFHRHRHLTAQGKRSTVVTVAIARELAAFLWAEMTDQPHERSCAPPDHHDRRAGVRRATGASARRTLDASMRSRLAKSVRGSQRPDTVLRSRPAHLRVTVVDSFTPVARSRQPPPP